MTEAPSSLRLAPADALLGLRVPTKAALLGLPRGPVGALMAAPVLGALSIEVVRLLSSMRLAKQPRKVGYLLGAVSLGLLVLAIGASVAMGWLALP